MIEELSYYSGKKPHAYKLNGKEYEVKTWADMAISLFENLYSINPQIFEELAEKDFKNPKSPLVSKSEYSILNRSRKLANAEIYIEMHHSTVSFIRFMVMILEKYNLQDKFAIIIEEEK